MTHRATRARTRRVSRRGKDDQVELRAIETHALHGAVPRVVEAAGRFVACGLDPEQPVDPRRCPRRLVSADPDVVTGDVGSHDLIPVVDRNVGDQVQGSVLHQEVRPGDFPRTGVAHGLRHVALGGERDLTCRGDGAYRIPCTSPCRRVEPGREVGIHLRACGLSVRPRAHPRLSEPVLALHADIRRRCTVASGPVPRDISRMQLLVWTPRARNETDPLFEVHTPIPPHRPRPPSGDIRRRPLVPRVGRCGDRSCLMTGCSSRQLGPPSRVVRAGAVSRLEA